MGKVKEFQVGDLVRYVENTGYLNGFFCKDKLYMIKSTSEHWLEGNQWLGIHLPNLVGYEERVKLGLEPNWRSSNFELVHRNTKVTNILYE